MRPLPGPDLGTRVIVAYKMVRGTAALLLSSILAAGALTGGADHLRQIGQMLHDHASSALTMRLAELVVRSATQRYLTIGAIALACDGSFTLFEGWALKKRFPWGPWLVVVATASFLPWELVELYRHLKLGRLVLLMLNLAVVGYLVRRKMLEPR